MNFEDSSSPSAWAIKKDYVEFLAKTKFILCPRGQGVGSIRVFEAMKAGRVPVIISDRYVLPKAIDWDACAIQIYERDIHKIPAIIASKMDDWEAMALAARVAWLSHFSERQFFRYLTDNLELILSGVEHPRSARQIGYPVRVGLELAGMQLRPALGRLRTLGSAGRARS